MVLKILIPPGVIPLCCAVSSQLNSCVVVVVVVVGVGVAVAVAVAAVVRGWSSVHQCHSQSRSPTWQAVS